jgi:copper chaperone
MASSQKHEFSMEMTCEGCSNAAKRVLAKIGVTDVTADLTTKKLVVSSDKPSGELLEALKKTGKEVQYIGAC